MRELAHNSSRARAPARRTGGARYARCTTPTHTPHTPTCYMLRAIHNAPSNNQRSQHSTTRAPRSQRATLTLSPQPARPPTESPPHHTAAGPSSATGLSRLSPGATSGGEECECAQFAPRHPPRLSPSENVLSGARDQSSRGRERPGERKRRCLAPLRCRTQPPRRMPSRRVPARHPSATPARRPCDVRVRCATLDGKGDGAARSPPTV